MSREFGLSITSDLAAGVCWWILTVTGKELRQSSATFSDAGLTSGSRLHRHTLGGDTVF